MANLGTFLVRLAFSTVRQYAKNTWIKVPYSSLGLSSSWKNYLAKTLNQGFDTVSEAFSSDGYVRIDVGANTITKRGRSDVSENLIYSPAGDQTKYITDNIIPHPWEINIEGYIPYNVSFGGAIQALIDNTVGRYTGSASVTGLRRKVARILLERTYERALPVAFKDDNQKVYNQCAIKDIEFIPSAESENNLRVRMTLVELRTISVTSNDILDAFNQMNSPENGSLFGESTDIGASAVELASQAVATLAERIGFAV